MINYYFIQYIKLWNDWRKRNDSSLFYKLMVLCKLTRSPSFETFKAFCNVRNLAEQVAYSMNKLSDTMKNLSITISANGVKEEKEDE